MSYHQIYLDEIATTKPKIWRLGGALFHSPDIVNAELIDRWLCIDLEAELMLIQGYLEQQTAAT